jgi:hypothetical protein
VLHLLQQSYRVFLSLCFRSGKYRNNAVSGSNQKIYLPRIFFPRSHEKLLNTKKASDEDKSKNEAISYNSE